MNSGNYVLRKYHMVQDEVPTKIGDFEVVFVQPCVEPGMPRLFSFNVFVLERVNETQ